MCRTQNMLVIYKDFYDYMGKPEWFKLKKPKMLEFSDVFPLVYLKLLLEGAADYQDIKHADQFHEGIIVSSSHMAKGLEFDHVLVPFSDAGNYRTEMDRGLLYIACTRAMHMLTLTYSGEASPFLPEMA
ncbi:ATP-binding domain-containing protein [Paenibacillus dendritiformis]|uniref:ATP-binding domain-containing protein n=1 Tax=Paenibacillus dendritiformis TaxID=130049 RepID=UPI0030B9099A